MKKQKSTAFDPQSKTIMYPDYKKESQSVQQLAENFEDQSRRSVAKVKSALVKQTEEYFTYLNCDCTPDFYNRVLGPTADEAFLQGLQTIFDVCSKFMYCHKEPEIQVQPPSSAKSVPQVISEVLASIGIPPEVVNEIVQTSFAALQEEKPELASKILQTSTPEMVSRILQTIGLEPELVSQIIQTISFESLKPSLYSGEAQTTPPPSMTSVEVQTSQTTQSESVTEESKEESVSAEEPPQKMCVCCKCTFPESESVSSLDEPPSQPETKVWICSKCYSLNKPGTCCSKPKPPPPECLKANSEAPTKLKLCRCYECSAPVLYRIDKTQQECLCSKPKVKCKCRGDRRKSSGSHIAFAKGDTCSLVETSCCCETHKC